ncbi:HAD-IC family P-type ATPase [Candidatus Saccharibacteria bacterium]|nr:HAD-IC family P-type ATPase [Candidatus Saccharibacteria bacterium]
MNLTGLTKKQVESRIEEGKVNSSPRQNRTSITKIILKNSLTIFNLVNLVLAILIIVVGSYKNLLFIFIALANTLISIINEVRAKKTVDKMRLIAEQKPTVIREGKTIQIDQNQLVEGDLIIYSLGDQILVDSEIKDGTVEVNESFVTGEQDNVKKNQGDKLVSGSFVVSGTCKAEAVAVGKESELNKLELNAHTIKTANSKLFTLMNNIVKYISIALIPIGVLLLWSRFRVENSDTTTAVTSTVASLINMIPEGLILLTSSVLALATIRLSRKQILVQDLYSIETLARVDTIALDKTGTLTTGNMTVKELVPASPQQKDALENALKLILSTDTANNATSTALKRKLLKNAKFEPTEQIKEIIPFSSDRKYSGVTTSKTTYLMGAPEFLINKKHYSTLEKTKTGDYRVLVVIEDKTWASERKELKGTTQKLLGFVLLEDELRKDAKNIINYFYDNNVDVKIISGDNLQTVQNIASKTGVKNYDNVIDFSTIKFPNYSKLVQENTIFARVKPAEKKNLIRALKKQGKTVAMTGDGVNDILAMKESDVSIAIGEGSDAARRSAKLVLLNSGFESVPSIIDEGRQSINNLERSTALFLAKTVYAGILAVIFIFIPVKYPFSSPVEMSLLNFACIGFPGLILALEHNTERIKNRFTRNILEYSVPVGLTISISMLTLSLLSHFGVFPHYDLSTAAVFVTFAIDLILIYWISKPLNLLRASLLIVIIGILIGAFLIPFFHSFFDFVFLSSNGLIVTLAAIASSIFLFGILRRLMKHVSTRVFDHRDI